MIRANSSEDFQLIFPAGGIASLFASSNFLRTEERLDSPLEVDETVGDVERCKALLFNFWDLFDGGVFNPSFECFEDLGLDDADRCLDSEDKRLRVRFWVWWASHLLSEDRAFLVWFKGLLSSLTFTAADLPSLFDVAFFFEMDFIGATNLALLLFCPGWGDFVDW